MSVWFNLAYLLLGVAFLVRGLRSRAPKDPFLYFGVGVILSATADLLPESVGSLSTALEACAALAMIVAAVFMFAFAEPAKAKPDAEKP